MLDQAFHQGRSLPPRDKYVVSKSEANWRDCLQHILRRCVLLAMLKPPAIPQSNQATIDGRGSLRLAGAITQRIPIYLPRKVMRFLIEIVEQQETRSVCGSFPFQIRNTNEALDGCHRPFRGTKLGRLRAGRICLMISRRRGSRDRPVFPKPNDASQLSNRDK